jgi:hypothetical protein
MVHIVHMVTRAKCAAPSVDNVDMWTMLFKSLDPYLLKK